ncbi:hypothetical protein KIW84_054205 [Lathyrus oleraceus]|uniref:Uncharacterized protein n=1 Tax=Pisum sativum TaxID=3888 RepID=A0A9D5AH75_PEA|nr:hypothetical protein KIW84_054205 [Pisum sativum]
MLSICVRLMVLKSYLNVPDQCMEFFAKMILDVTPVKENMYTSYYDAKRMMSKLGLYVKKIDCCIGGRVLFYDNEFGSNDRVLEECKFCKSLRLQRMFASMHNASQMTWYHTNIVTSSMMRHPFDGERDELGRTSLLNEIHLETHIKRNEKFVDDRSRNTQHPELPAPPLGYPADPNLDFHTWYDVAYGKRKNKRVYGPGGYAKTIRQRDRSFRMRLTDGKGSSRPPMLTDDMLENVTNLVHTEIARETTTRNGEMEEMRRKQAEMKEELRRKTMEYEEAMHDATERKRRFE